VEEASKKEIRQIKKDPHTKVTTEVVLQVEEKAVDKNQTKVTFSVSIFRSMVTTLGIVLKCKRIKKMMQSLQSMKKKRCC
jgi:hypothetical protein